MVQVISGFNAQIDEVLAKYPGLSRHSIDGVDIIKGTIDLIDTFGQHRDTYEIEIHPTSGYPFRFPLLWETGGRIPRNIDWHVFESDGHCCIKVEPEEIIMCKKGISLIDFIDKEVIPYFFNQTFRRINGYFIKERSHGLLGVIEYYQQVLKEQNPFKMVQLLEFIQSGVEPFRTSTCFCGSNLKYRKCHRDGFRLLKQLSDGVLETHIRIFRGVLAG